MISLPCSRWRLRRASAAALVPLVVLALSGPCAAHALSLDEAIALAQAHSPAMSARDSEVRALREQAVQAGTRPDPVLRLSLDNLPINGADRWSTTRDFMTARSIGLAQTLPSGEKRAARTAERERQADALAALAGSQAVAVRREAAWAWWALRAASQRRQALQVQAVQAADLVLAADAAWRGGRGSANALLTAREQEQRLRQALLASDAESGAARAALQRWTGEPVPERLAEAPAIDTGLPDAAELLARHPDGQAATVRVAASRAMAHLAHAERSSDWSVELMLSQRGPRYADMVSLGVSIPLTLQRGRRQNREVAARLAEVDAREAEAEEVMRELDRQLQTWRLEWQAALAQRELIDRQREPLTRQRAQMVLAAYRAGQETLASVIEAQQAALSLALERIDVELSAARAWSALAYALPPTEGITARGERP